MPPEAVDQHSIDPETIDQDPIDKDLIGMKWSVGLMTGTVLDGNIDVALLRTDGERVLEFGPWQLVPYESAAVALIAEAIEQAREWNFAGREPAVFGAATQALSTEQALAVLGLLEEAGISSRDVDVVGLHGQTVLHRAPHQGRPGRTRQLGDGALMATMLGVDVVCDFRSNDVAQGGQGAPLSPVYHQTLLHELGDSRHQAFLNLGGVANLTWTAGERLIAFDTGPANAPINDWVRGKAGLAMDVDGQLGSQGRVDEDRLLAMLEHPWFKQSYPKSLDRFSFPASLAEGLTLIDGAATLTAFAAASVAKGLSMLPARTDTLIVGGGGRRNPTLMHMLGERTGAEVVAAEACQWRGDALEAEAFAYLAQRSKRGLPLSFPTTTGVPSPTLGGVLYKGEGEGTGAV